VFCVYASPVAEFGEESEEVEGLQNLLAEFRERPLQYHQPYHYPIRVT